MKRVIVFSVLFLMVASFTFVYAVPDVNKFELKDNGNEKSVFKLPESARQVASNVFYLGESIENGKKIEGYAIIKYKDKKAVPDFVAVKKDKVKDALCYAYLSDGAKWKSVEDYLINPVNDYNLDMNDIASIFDFSIAKWENAANYDILGEQYITNETLSADTLTTDGRNEVYFGAIDDENVIGVTIIWGVFSGPAKRKVLLEWDMIFNEEYLWTIDGGNESMDFENIATHEIGHAVGMGDLYDSVCDTQTMYGYSGYGDFAKRTLEYGDIAGVFKLYG